MKKCKNCDFVFTDDIWLKCGITNDDVSENDKCDAHEYKNLEMVLLEIHKKGVEFIDNYNKNRK